MTRSFRALLLVLAIAVPFVLLQPHVSAEPRDYVQQVVCAPEYAWDCGTALSIVYRESRYDSQAVNPWSLCSGWFQISPIHGYSIDTLMDPQANTAIAYSLYQQRGWQPWQ